MKWAKSLIRIADHRIEELKKRLGEIAERRVAAELKIASLDAEAEMEDEHVRTTAESGWYMIGFRDGWRARRAAAVSVLALVELEERGARDALTEAYEELKRVEHVAELARVAEARKEAQRETAALDELALQRSARQPR